MKQMIKTGKGLLWGPVEIYPETTLDSLLKLCKEL